MKKLFRIVLLLLTIFSLIGVTVVYANPDAIDIGTAAINRGSELGSSTRVVRENSANASGTIDTVEIRAKTEMTDVEVATFVIVSGDNLSTRDSEHLGTAAGGSKQTFSGLSMSVVTGDYLGVYYSGGTLETDTAGGEGYWYFAADQIPCTNVEFGSNTVRTLSLYGTGETANGVSAPTVVTNAASSIEETTATLSGNITATGGENCTDRGFQWDIDTGAPYADNWTEAGNFGVGNFTHGVTGLPAGTTIYYRASANNSAGWGYGSEVTFTTKSAAAPPPAAPSDIIPEGIPAPIGIGHLAWFIPLVLFSVPAFWRRNALLFMLAAACSLMMGFYWYVIFTTNLGMSLGILLAAFGLVCLIFALGCLFKRGKASE